MRNPHPLATIARDSLSREVSNKMVSSFSEMLNNFEIE
jgi:hypothetical protein